MPWGQVPPHSPKKAPTTLLMNFSRAARRCRRKVGDIWIFCIGLFSGTGGMMMPAVARHALRWSMTLKLRLQHARRLKRYTQRSAWEVALITPTGARTSVVLR